MRALKSLVPAFALALAAASPLPAFGQTANSTVTAASPDGTLVLTVSTDSSNRPIWSLIRKGKLLIGASKLGFTLTDGLNMVRGFRITGSETASADQTWEQPWGERRFVTDKHNEVLVHFQQNADYGNRLMNVRFRLFDNGFGLRYELPAQPGLKTMKIADEWTEFDVAQAGTAWWITAGEWNRYEQVYQKTPIDAVSTAHTPITMRLDDGTHLAFHEAALVDYAGMWFKRAEGRQFRSTLAPSSSGARVIREKKDYDFIQQLFVSPDPSVIQPAQTAPGFPLTIGPIYPGGVPSPYLDKDSKTLWAGKLQFEYRPAEGTLLYAGINRGVKAGSYNAQLNGGLATPDSAIKYGAETLWSYEGGFKLSLLDNKVRLNGAVYYYDYKNYQSFLFTGVAGLVINADARTYGGEISLQANPIPGLDMALTFSQFNAKVKDVPLRVGGPIRKDLKPTYAPETQASGIIRYGWDMLGGEMAANANITYQSSFFYNLRNFDADKFGGYANVDLGLAWTSASKMLEVGVRVDNVTNHLIGLQGYDLAGLCGCNEVSYKPPRTFSLHTRVSF